MIRLERITFQLININTVFYIILKIIYKYKLKKISKIHRLFFLSDENLNSLYVSRYSRIGLYKVGINERLISLQKSYRTQNIELSKNECVIDIGANIGEFGKFWVEKQHVVYAFEPDVVEFEALKLNLSNSSLFNLGLWNKSDVLKFYHKNNSGDSSFFETNDFEKISEVKVNTLDSFNIKEPIGLIKIESEGAEPEIIEGGRETIKKSKFVTIDCGEERGLKSESTLIPVVNKLLELGFELIDFEPTSLRVLMKNKLKK
tara:strand:- start:221 stop:1000 length:780 start_codon:yes stop_codon:yes gene_type:complete